MEEVPWKSSVEEVPWKRFRGRCSLEEVLVEEVLYLGPEENQGTRGPRDHGTTGPRDHRVKGPKGQGTEGPRDHKAQEPKGQGTHGSRDQTSNGTFTGKYWATLGN